MMISSSAALWFAPFVIPLCIVTFFNDARTMKIKNGTVLALLAVFAVVGLVALPFDVYLWRWVHAAVMLVVMMALWSARAMGAGDAKFLTAATPFVHLGDLALVAMIIAASMIAATATVWIAKLTPLHRLAPHWQSWTRGKDIPMGTGFGGALAFYLVLGIFLGR